MFAWCGLVWRTRLFAITSARAPPTITTHLLFHTSSARPSSPPSYYDELGVHPRASSKEIKTAFYKLSKQFHPDMNVDNPAALQRFQAVSESYEVLSNPEKRQRSPITSYYFEKMMRRCEAAIENDGRIQTRHEEAVIS